MRKGVVIPLVIVGGTGVFLIINHFRKQALYNKLMKDLETGAKSEDTFQEIGVLTQSGGALDPAYYKKASSTLLSSDVAAADVKKLQGWIHGLFGISDETSIISFFKSLASKAQVSQLADLYLKTYNISLANDLKTVDYTLFALPVGEAYLPKIQAAIQSLPDK
jgi:hypothetical protein